MRPIDISIIIKSVDEVAKFNKNQEVALNIQQTHAQQEMQEQNKINSETVVKAAPIIMNSINPDKKNKDLTSDIEKRKKRVLNKRNRKKAPNKGRWIDLEG